MNGPERGGGRGGRGGRGGGYWRGGRGRGQDFRGQEVDRGGRGRGGQGRGGRRNDGYRVEREHPMGYNRMTQLIGCLDNEILITLIDGSNGFDKELELDHSAQRDHGRMLIKLELMARCCSCESAPRSLIEFLTIVNSSGLVKNGYLNNFVMDIITNQDIPPPKYSKGMVDLLILMKTFFIRMPNSEFVNRSRLTLLALEQLINQRSDIVTDDLQILFTEIQSLKAEQLSKTEPSKKPSMFEEDNDDNVPPPDDFRDLSVVPSINDITRNEETFLRANKAQGKYEDLNHYLDVQYRLLREDFVYPLRTGILTYLDIRRGGLPPGTQLPDVRIYENVHILGAQCTGQGLAYRLRFDNSAMKKIRWEVSKRLIFGSLLALSSDDFATMYLCTVVNRNPKDLAKGILEVQVEEQADEFAKIEPNVTFTMAETTAYFESYRHVLTALQEIQPVDFPFQRYIVRCNKAIAVPRYLQRNGEVRFDFRPLIADSDDNADPADRRRFRDVPVLDVDEWPSAKRLNLDDSQYDALKHCLTKEFALVQGPPGTGKTFLGLKVMQLLLHNWDKWHEGQADDGDDTEEPILVVCYTNHALDQFLEGIKDITNKQIVRVGSRSQSEVLKECSLNNIRSDMKKQRRIPVALHSASRRLQSEMSALQDEIHISTCVIEGIDDNIIQLDRLRDVMSHDHISQLYGTYYTANDPLVAWLMEEDFQPYQGQFQYNNQGQLQYGNNQGQLPYYDEGDENFENDPLVMGQAEAGANELSDEEIDEEERRRQLEEDVDKPEAEKKKTESRDKLMQEVGKEYFVPLDLHSAQEAHQESDWQTVRGKKKKGKNRKRLAYIQRNAIPMSEEEVNDVEDISLLSTHDRHRLYKYWREAYKMMIRQKCRDNEEIYHLKSIQLKEARHQLDKAIMQTAVVVGMTTTAAARYHLVLQEIHPRVIIVEEAAEVLEAHVVTALSRNCEHFILIGDHQQLRPSPTVYELATRFNLDLSLFERMVNNRIPVQTLALQHRMRPLISKLMKPFYSRLLDHDSVQDYPKIRGIEQNLYFVTHNHAEKSQEELRSKTNVFEAEYIQRLCKYLLMQDYNPSQITVLTPYSGQLFQLKKLLRDSCKGVRIAVVDNFQGEENDIIILSLVRCNKNGKLGFLKIENRVCVALSRAKMGLFVIGDVNFLADYSKIWLNMKTIAEKEGVISGALPLACQQHPENQIKAALPKDFDEAPEGGCMQPCNTRLDCGHACPRPCHNYDLQHENIQCTRPCTKYLCSEHVCPKKCSEPCGPCLRQVMKRIPTCNHEAILPCHKDPSTWACRLPCAKVLDCGHNCSNNCGDSCVRNCLVLVKRKLPCGHQCEMKCHEDAETFSCTFPCQAELMCTHVCPGTCGSCRQGCLHQGCTSKCDRTLICGHACEALCSVACPPCKKACENQCPHSKCTKMCGEPCKPCKEKCEWTCRHHSCSKLCSEPCDRPKCNEPCPKKLKKCGHPCIGLCGEICPKVCRICDKRLVTEIFFGSEDEPDARFVVLDCGHIVEVDGMDTWMATESGSEIQLKGCPKCKTWIRKTFRYKEKVKTVLCDIEDVKKIVLGDFNQARQALKLSELWHELSEENGEEFAMSLLKHLESCCRPPLNREHYEEAAATRFLEVLQNRKLTLSQDEFASLENLMNFAIALGKLNKKLKKDAREFLLNDCQDFVDFFLNLRRILQSWLTEKIRTFSRLSEQQCLEFKQELIRTKMALKLCSGKKQLTVHCRGKADSIKAAEANAAFKMIDNVFQVVRRNKPFTEQRRERCDDVLKEVARNFPEGGLKISEEERIQIVQAMGMSQGHWYKCPNGHVYVITECGGAVTESKCPDCGATIGGSSHQLRADNQLATEMDGASRPAYPTALMR